ncbi:hypothetical protein EZV62_024085 [Acer yangbiense]|uniref:Retrotransposon gag domain-containing protein n=1 Tax=Acer yangbiense TaxID=1000413 RepID=A0A5C7H3S5_9ROSI|nr:hypothetical protein EZV62_024085 [Acer yangbiense]
MSMGCCLCKWLGVGVIKPNQGMLGGAWPSGSSEVIAVLDQLVEQKERIILIKQAHTDLLKDLETKFKKVQLKQIVLTNSVSEKIKLLDEIVVLRRALNNPNTSKEGPMSKIKVPKPKQFNGSRKAKELENFLWDMERYFKVARIHEREHMSITSMYLSGDAKLWWRTRIADDLSASKPNIVVWELLKNKLKDQFLPCNTSWLVRENPQEVEEVRNMSEKYKLFNFMYGLQTWAQAELRRQGVKDIPSAMAVAEGVVDFWMKFPKEEKVNALISLDADCCVDANPSRVNSLQLLNTISEIQAMLDTGATNNFVAQREVDRLGLKLSCSGSQIKAMNSLSKPVHGVVETTVKIGS